MTVDKWYLRKGVWWLVAVTLVAVYVGREVYGEYRRSFCAVGEEPPYEIPQRHADDTLRVVIIGDSWAEYHSNLQCDTIFLRFAKRLTSRPVKCVARGKGGAKSGEIYYMMFSRLTDENPFEHDRCTQPLLEQHPDYCVVFAGINDVVHKRDADYYAGNLRNIIRLLLRLDIRPVVMEIPTVDYPEMIRRKEWHQRLLYAMASLLPGAAGVAAESHRKALLDMLGSSNMADSVLYIPAAAWNAEGLDDQRDIHTDDRVHLNLTGYRVLDSCIVSQIIDDAGL